MLFTKSLSDVAVGTTVGRIENSGRIFPCVVCNKLTPWVDVTETSHPGAHVCSDECLDLEDENRKLSHAPTTCTAPDLQIQQTPQGDLGNDRPSNRNEESSSGR